jgi:hypothetical protein
MDLSPDLTRYLTWAAVVVFGALLAVVDRRQIRRPVFGLLLLIGVVAGFIIEQVSPFSFGVESHYMEGVLVSAGSALALIGYVFAVFWQFVWRSVGRFQGLSGQRDRRKSVASDPFRPSWRVTGLVVIGVRADMAGRGRKRRE